LEKIADEEIDVTGLDHQEAVLSPRPDRDVAGLGLGLDPPSANRLPGRVVVIPENTLDRHARAHGFSPFAEG
jgi:hypothetical protein